MGAAISNNVAKQIISSSQSIATSYTQTCSGSGSQVFGLDTSNGCVTQTGDINITNTQVINVACMTNDTTKSSMRADIQAQILQQSLAAAQSIGGPSLSFARLVTDFAEDASQQITTLYTETCIGTANQSVGIACTDPNSKLTVGAINVSNTQNVYVNCVTNNSTINNLTSRLAGIIKTETSAQEADSLVAFAVVGLVFLAIIGIGFLYTANGPIGWIIIAIIAVIVVVMITYAALAFSKKLYPFNQQTNVN
jgi:hypothetical protein